nr:retropepsin-like aspartic protease [uncultured Duganella sp.]
MLVRQFLRLAAGLCLAAATLPGLAASADNASSAGALLARARDAVGGDAWRQVTTQHTQFVRTYLDHDESGSSDIDFASGRYAQRIPTSAVARLMSRSDGHSFWRQRMGKLEKQEGAAGNPELHLARQSYAWWFARGAKARTLALKAPRRHAGADYAVVRVELDSGIAFDYWINDATHRIERRQEVVDGKTFTIDYRDFRRVGALTLPFEESVRDAADAADEETLRVSTIVLNRPAAQMDFSLPQPAVMQGFSAARPTVTIPFEPCDAHICVMLTLNGQGPFKFILDTGARNVLSDKLYRRLQLPAQGVAVLSGLGQQTERGVLTTVRQVGLAGLTLERQAFFTSPTLDNLPIDGTIGYEWLSQTPTLIDYAARRLTFHDPERFVYSGTAAATPLSFHDKTPQIEAVLDGLPGKFTIDTGSDFSLTMSKPFVERHGLVEKYRAGDTVQTAQVIGGTTEVLQTRGKLFELGGVRIADPTLELSTRGGGTMNSPTLAGNISNGILRQLSILFDYQGGKVYIAPNKVTSAE